MTVTPTATVELVWDLTRERPTLGGALVLRQEGELLARHRDLSAVTLQIICPAAERSTADRLAATVFGSSVIDFQISPISTTSELWPAAAERAHPHFSYFSFARLLDWHATHDRAPRLQWHEHTRGRVQQARLRFPGRLICVHLRSVAPFTPEESNADGHTWDRFFSRHAQPGVRDFLLLGDDPLPLGLSLRPGLTRATDWGWDLATQLALIAQADGFLGMASGICTAANLSATPHVIFKHPAHHPAEMMRELGASDRFPFATPRQRLWRRPADDEALDKALALIAP